MTENRVLFTPREAATRYVYPIGPALLTATAEGSAETLATVREGSTAIVERLAVVNQSGSPVNLTVNFVPEGGAIGASNRQISALSIAAGDHVDLTDIIGGLYPSGTQIQAFAGSASALLISGYIEARL